MPFRNATDQDLPSIAELADHNGLLIPPLDQAAFTRMLNWLHTQAPTGKRLEFIYEEDGKALAHFGAVPFAMKVKQERLLAGFAANIVIDQDARKKALFFPLQKHFVNLFPTLGYSFAYGVMTRAGVLKPHLAVGWKEIGALKVYARPVSAGMIFTKLFPKLGFKRTIETLAKPFQWLFDTATLTGKSKVEVTEVVGFDSSHDKFLEAWTNKQDITAIRSADILNWRFVAFKERNYRITVAHRNGIFCGYLVTRNMPMKQFSSLAIVDVVAMDDDEETASTLLNHCAKIAKQENVDFISTAFPKHYCFRKLLQRKGFIETKEKFTLVIRIPKESELAIQPADFNRWFISWFDHDFV